ncbi:MAG: hypothetical protein ACOYMG_21930 [Candidatus Methylumidiphilus sp.]
MARHWTIEERAKHAAAIRAWKPWDKSTGPKTVTGKTKARMNAVKHMNRCYQIRMAYKDLADTNRRIAMISEAIKNGGPMPYHLIVAFDGDGDALPIPKPYGPS